MDLRGDPGFEPRSLPLDFLFCMVAGIIINLRVFHLSTIGESTNSLRAWVETDLMPSERQGSPPFL